MIFAAKNEDNESTWELAKNGIKKVTSRAKKIAVGKTFAIQPGRGKKAVCRAKVISCENRLQHYHHQDLLKDGNIKRWKQREAKLEGFYSWDGLMHYFQEHKLNFMDLYRIEFVLVEEKEEMMRENERGKKLL